jgi:hypothetical protein
VLPRFLTEMIADVRTLADIVNQTAAITDAAITEWLNKGLFEVHVAFVAAGGDKMFRTSLPITTIAGTASYNLPFTMLELTAVEMTINGNDRVMLHPFETYDRPYLLSASPGWSGQPTHYRVQGKNSYITQGTIEFLPTPTGVYTITLWYIYAPTRLVAGGDSFDGVAGFEDYAIKYAVPHCAVKAETCELAAWCAGEMARIKTNALAQIRNRDALSPSRVVMSRDPWTPRARFRRYRL